MPLVENSRQQSADQTLSPLTGVGSNGKTLAHPNPGKMFKSNNGKKCGDVFQEREFIMKNLLLSKGFFPESLLRPTVNYILQTQLPNGCIPWFENGKADRWDHIEAAMGLTIGGELAAAQRAYQWLADEQLADGSW